MAAASTRRAMGLLVAAVTAAAVLTPVASAVTAPLFLRADDRGDLVQRASTAVQIDTDVMRINSTTATRLVRGGGGSEVRVRGTDTAIRRTTRPAIAPPGIESTGRCDERITVGTEGDVSGRVAWHRRRPGGRAP